MKIEKGAMPGEQHYAYLQIDNQGKCPFCEVFKLRLYLLP